MKTIEEAASIYLNEQIGTRLDSNKILEAFEAGVEFATRWILVEEELPPEMTTVLIKCMNGKRVQYDVDFIHNQKWAHRANVTHWRPIEFE